MMQNIKKSNLVIMCSVFQECLVYLLGSLIHKQETFLQFKVGKVLCGKIKSYFDPVFSPGFFEGVVGGGAGIRARRWEK